MNIRELLPALQYPAIESQTAFRLAAATTRVPSLIPQAEATAIFELKADARKEGLFKPQHRIFHHQLSDAICAMGDGSISKPDRIFEEFRLYLRVRDNYHRLIESGNEDFVRFVIDVGRAIVPSRNVLRTSGIVLKNRDSCPIRLPSANCIHDRLGRIGKILSAESEASPLIRAVWTYVLLLNLHPLNDGNGRLARVLFNCELFRQGAQADAYLPISSVMVAARGGYEIRLRQAEIFWRWDPIMNFFACMIELCSRTNLDEVRGCE